MPASVPANATKIPCRWCPWVAYKGYRDAEGRPIDPYSALAKHVEERHQEQFQELLGGTHVQDEAGLASNAEFVVARELADVCDDCGLQLPYGFLRQYCDECWAQRLRERAGVSTKTIRVGPPS